MKQNLIVGIVIILLVAGFAIFNILTEKQPVEYFLTTGTSEYDEPIIQEFRILKNMVKNGKLKETMTNSITFERETVLEYFNEEFFTNKKLAVVTVYEDNSKEYIYSINDLTYNDDKTEATIKYTYKVGTYADTFASTWYNYMFVELEPTVTKVNLVLDNNSEK